MSVAHENLSDKKNWNDAVVAVRREGIKVMQNVNAVTVGAVSHHNLNINEDDAYAFTYGGQRLATVWDEDYDVLVRRYANNDGKRVPVETVYFYHGNGAAEVVVREFSSRGFDVSWNGTESGAVIIKMF